MAKKKGQKPSEKPLDDPLVTEAIDHLKEMANEGVDLFNLPVRKNRKKKKKKNKRRWRKPRADE
jgi:hypothetical protein